MTTTTVLNGLNPLYFCGVVVPKMCPKRVASRGLKLVPVAPGVKALGRSFVLDPTFL